MTSTSTRPACLLLSYLPLPTIKGSACWPMRMPPLNSPLCATLFTSLTLPLSNCTSRNWPYLMLKHCAWPKGCMKSSTTCTQSTFIRPKSCVCSMPFFCSMCRTPSNVPSSTDRPRSVWKRSSSVLSVYCPNTLLSITTSAFMPQHSTFRLSISRVSFVKLRVEQSWTTLTK